jgi:hypothetical protein
LKEKINITDSGRILNTENKPFFQPKLTINQPNDAYEVEANAMADKVMRMEMHSNGLQLKPLPISSVQRKCAHCEEEQKMQRKEMNGSETTADAGLESYVGGLHTGGQALSAEARNFYEPRFGYDFSKVKVHTDSVAAKSAQSINALAYTSGSNIVFNSGQYSPNTDSGKKLLGHELTHVVQQGSNAIRRKPRSERPAFASMPFDTDLITDPIERMEFLRTEYALYEWRKSLERLKKGELDDKDLKNANLLNRITGFKKADIESLITKIKAFQVQRDKDVLDINIKEPEKKIPVTTIKIIEWLEVRKVISTPMPDGGNVNYSSPGVIGSYSYKTNKTLITVMPDMHGQADNNTGPSTNFEGRFAWQIVSGKIVNLKKDGNAFNPNQLEIIIRTKYSLNPDLTSGYGKGTTDADKADGTTTLRVHEGQHGTDYINFLSSKPLPVNLTSGVNGNLTELQFKSILKYTTEITKASCETTDQIGFSQDEFLKTPAGIASGIVSCRK